MVRFLMFNSNPIRSGLLSLTAVLVASLLLLPIQVNAQLLDSLKQELAQAGTDSARLQSLFRLSWAGLRSDVSVSQTYVAQALALSRQLGDSNSIYRAYHHLGLINRLSAKYDSAMYYFQEVYDYRMRTDQQLETDNVLFNMGVITFDRGWFDQSLDYYLRGLAVAEESDDQFMQADLLNSIGIIHRKMKNYRQAVASTTRALRLFESLGLKNNQAFCNGNLGTIYRELGQLDSALVYYQRSLSLSEAASSQWELGFGLMDLGALYSEMGHYDSALHYTLRSLELREEMQNPKELVESQLAVAEVYNRMGAPQASLPYSLQAIQLAQRINTRERVSQAHQVMAETYALMEQYPEAYRQMKSFVTMKDSLLNQQRIKQMNDLQARYETERKEKEIAQLQAEQLRQQADLRQKNLLITFLIIGFLLIILLLYTMFRYFRQGVRSRTQLAAQEAEISRRRIAELEKNQQLTALNAMINGQEEERKRIAKDLHDGLGGLLSTVQLHFSTLGQRIDLLEETESYRKSYHLLNDACQEVRKIAHNMMPGALMKLGLVAALQDICESYNQSGDISVDLQTFDMDERLPGPVEVSVYRMVQEMLSNIRKHARASEVIVQLSRTENSLMLVVEDDGVGFDTTATHKGEGLGLRSIASRVSYLKGTWEVSSQADQGTTFTVDIPLTPDHITLVTV